MADKLSDQVRAGSEAAAWVAEAIKALEGDLEVSRLIATSTVLERDAAQARVKFLTDMLNTILQIPNMTEEQLDLLTASCQETTEAKT